MGTKPVVKERLIILARYRPRAMCHIENFIISTGISSYPASSYPALVFDLNRFTVSTISDAVVSKSTKESLKSPVK